jgi:hypothetical protein
MFFLVVATRNHFNIFAPIKALLGTRSRFVNLGGVSELQTAAHSELIGFEELAGRLAPGDVLVVATDWTPPGLVDLLNIYKGRGILSIGVVEGALWNLPNKYRIVDHLLVWGNSAIKGSRCRSVHIVGSPIIENAWQPVPIFKDPPFVLINYKFVDRWNQGRETWLRDVTSACNVVGVDYLISRHPRDNQTINDVRFSNRSVPDLLREAASVITRPSTIVFEAIAARKPVILFPTHGEPLGEFAEPMGAFPVVHSPKKLLRVLRSALSERQSYWKRSQKFFEHHVSVDPQNAAAERIASMLLKLQSSD